jgi:hypothetical protein
LTGKIYLVENKLNYEISIDLGAQTDVASQCTGVADINGFSIQNSLVTHWLSFLMPENDLPMMEEEYMGKFKLKFEICHDLGAQAAVSRPCIGVAERKCWKIQNSLVLH